MYYCFYKLKKSFYFLPERHYKVAIHLANPKGAEPWVQGFLKVTLLSDRGVIRGMDLTPSNYVK